MHVPWLSVMCWVPCSCTRFPWLEVLMSISWSCIHKHSQVISLCPVCAQHGDTRSTPLFYHFCAGISKAQANYLKVASLVPFQFGKPATRPEKLLGWRSKNLSWSSAPGGSQVTEVAKRFAETTKSSDIFPQLNQWGTTKRAAGGQQSQERWCVMTVLGSSRADEKITGHHGIESLRSNYTHTAPGRQETLLKVPRSSKGQDPPRPPLALPRSPGWLWLWRKSQGKPRCWWSMAKK